MSRMTPATLRYLRSTVNHAPSIFHPAAARPSQRTGCARSEALPRSPHPAGPPARLLSTTAPRAHDAPAHDAPARPDRRRTPGAPTAPESHYDLFPRTFPQGGPPGGPFGVDARALRSEFLALQGRAHPDRHAGAADKRRAAARSARINDAYRTLQSPLLRAQHLLRLRGRDVAGDEHARVEEPGLLGEVMEARERIEEARTELELEPVRSENEARVDECVAALEEAFRDGDDERAVREAVRLRYWVNIRESLDSWEKGKPVVLVH